VSECAIVDNRLCYLCEWIFDPILFICNIVPRWFIKGWALLPSRTRFGVCWDYIRLLLFALRCGRVKNYDTV
jgi:hypothetical protein